MTTGELIKTARKRAGITQKELGKKLGLSYQSIAQWENNLRKPKMETLNRIAAALGIEALDLVPEGKKSEYVDSYMAYVKDCKEKGLEYVPEWSGKAPISEESRRFRLLYYFDHLLNEEGQKVAAERLEELAKVPEYQQEHVKEKSQGDGTP